MGSLCRRLQALAPTAAADFSAVPQQRLICSLIGSDTVSNRPPRVDVVQMVSSSRFAACVSDNPQLRD